MCEWSLGQAPDDGNAVFVWSSDDRRAGRGRDMPCERFKASPKLRIGDGAESLAELLRDLGRLGPGPFGRGGRHPALTENDLGNPLIAKESVHPLDDLRPHMP